MAQCAIALGSNLGNSLSILETAVNELKAIAQSHTIVRSSWYQTEPIGPKQPDYINGCVIFNTSLTPEKLLEKLLAIEKKFGRTRDIYWGPRTLDLDIIFYENLIIKTPNLEIPHPRMAERAFVLVPLAEIAPDWLDPITQMTINQLLARIEIKGVKIL